MDRAVPAQPQSRVRDAVRWREQVPLLQPRPERAVAVQHVRAEVRLVRRIQRPRAAARLAVGVVEHDRRTGLGARDRRGQPRDPCADDRDRLHVAQATPKLVGITVPVVPAERGPVGPSPAAGAGPVGALDRDGDLPLHEQVERQLREGIQAGRIPAGAALPSTRALAAALGVSRGVITEAYGQLASEGYLAMRQGAPVRVAAAVQQRTARAGALAAPDVRVRPAARGPRPGRIPRDALAAFTPSGVAPSPVRHPRRSPIRAACHISRETLADPPRPRPAAQAADPEHLIVCGGFRAGFVELCRFLAAHAGRDSVAVEDPGWHPARLARSSRRASTSSRSRSTPTACASMRCRHRRPRGARSRRRTSSPPARPEPRAPRRPRRVGLRARRADHRGRLRLRARSEQRPGAVQGLAPERVVLLGSASKRLAPGLRLGWMLTPSWLTWPLTTTRAVEAIGGRRDHASSRSPTSSNAESSTATCAACAPGTRAAAPRFSSAFARRLPQLTVREAPPAGLFVARRGRHRRARHRRVRRAPRRRRGTTRPAPLRARRRHRPRPGLRRACRTRARPRDRAAVQHAAKRAVSGVNRQTDGKDPPRRVGTRREPWPSPQHPPASHRAARPRCQARRGRRRLGRRLRLRTAREHGLGRRAARRHRAPPRARDARGRRLPPGLLRRRTRRRTSAARPTCGSSAPSASAPRGSPPRSRRARCAGCWTS